MNNHTFQKRCLLSVATSSHSEGHVCERDRQQLSDVDDLVRRYNSGASAFALASSEGIRIQSLFQRFRRAGYRWDICRQRYSKYPIMPRRISATSELPERLIQVLLQCRGVKADRLLVAMRLGFSSVKEMDEHLGQFGYEWSREKRLYVLRDLLLES